MAGVYIGAYPASAHADRTGRVAVGAGLPERASRPYLFVPFAFGDHLLPNRITHLLSTMLASINLIFPIIGNKVMLGLTVAELAKNP
jgi:hypothetical protein